MAIEIEHKYLVVNDSYKQDASSHSEIWQGYLSRDPAHTIRVRIRDSSACITIKGKSAGAARCEFEYSIPLEDAQQLMQLCEPPIISKTRYIIMHDGNRWEVDEFHGALSGLVIAELEIPDEKYRYRLPAFVGNDVTNDKRFYNSQLGLSSEQLDKMK